MQGSLLCDYITGCVAGSESIILFIRSLLFLKRAMNEIIWHCVNITEEYMNSQKKNMSCKSIKLSVICSKSSLKSNLMLCYVFSISFFYCIMCLGGFLNFKLTSETS